MGRNGFPLSAAVAGSIGRIHLSFSSVKLSVLSYLDICITHIVLGLFEGL